MSHYDDLEKLNDLRQRNIITEEEYLHEKEKIFSRTSGNSSVSKFSINQYCMLIHLSQLLGSTGIGIIVPFILWQLKKDESPIIDQHGKVVANWIVSVLIYAIPCALLSFVVIGIPLLVALGVCNVIFIIIGAMKANSGELWKYPLSLEIIK